MPFAEQLDQLILGQVDVLVLVHQDVLEALAEPFAQLVVAAQQAHRLHDQVVEVERVVDLHALLVALIGGQGHPVGRRDDAAAETFGRLQRVEQVVLPVAHAVDDVLHLVLLGVHVQVVHDPLEQCRAVVLVEDGEVAGPTDQRGVLAQQARAEAVEGAHPHAGGAPALEQLLGPLLHLGGGLVGEGDRQDLLRRDTALTDEVRDAAGQRAGLARPGTGDDQQRTIPVAGGFALLGVQLIENGRHRLPFATLDDGACCRGARRAPWRSGPVAGGRTPCAPTVG